MFNFWKFEIFSQLSLVVDTDSWKIGCCCYSFVKKTKFSSKLATIYVFLVAKSSQCKVATQEKVLITQPLFDDKTLVCRLAGRLSAKLAKFKIESTFTGKLTPLCDVTVAQSRWQTCHFASFCLHFSLQIVNVCVDERFFENS